MGFSARAVRLGVVAVCIAIAGLSAGCTGERIAGWYVTRKIDGYLDLSSTQKDWVRSRVDHHLIALRKEMLPEAVRLMRRTRAVVARRPTRAEVKKLQRAVDDLVDRFVARLVPDTAALFAMLNDAQIEHFRTEVRADLDDSYGDLPKAPNERKKDAAEKLVEAVEDWVGDLTKPQVAGLLGLAKQLPDERPAIYRANVARLNDFVTFLRDDPDRQAIARKLGHMWRTRYEGLGPDRGHESRRAEQRRVLLTIDRMLTMEQRRHVVDEINDRIAKIKRYALP
ncbi:MAG: DUF6279 family lipoprotein [Myxococcota bacterium]